MSSLLSTLLNLFFFLFKMSLSKFVLVHLLGAGASKNPPGCVVAKFPCKLGSASTLLQAVIVVKPPASTTLKLASSFVVKLPSSVSSKLNQFN